MKLIGNIFLVILLALFLPFVFYHGQAFDFGQGVYNGLWWYMKWTLIIAFCCWILTIAISNAARGYLIQPLLGLLLATGIPSLLYYQHFFELWTAVYYEGFWWIVYSIIGAICLGVIFSAVPQREPDPDLPDDLSAHDTRALALAYMRGRIPFWQLAKFQGRENAVSIHELTEEIEDMGDLPMMDLDRLD